MSDRQITALF